MGKIIGVIKMNNASEREAFDILMKSLKDNSIECDITITGKIETLRGRNVLHKGDKIKREVKMEKEQSESSEVLEESEKDESKTEEEEDADISESENAEN